MRGGRFFACKTFPVGSGSEMRRFSPDTGLDSPPVRRCSAKQELRLGQRGLLRGAEEFFGCAADGVVAHAQRRCAYAAVGGVRRRLQQPGPERPGAACNLLPYPGGAAVSAAQADCAGYLQGYSGQPYRLHRISSLHPGQHDFRPAQAAGGFRPAAPGRTDGISVGYYPLPQPLEGTDPDRFRSCGHHGEGGAGSLHHHAPAGFCRHASRWRWPCGTWRKLLRCAGRSRWSCFL